MINGRGWKIYICIVSNQTLVAHLYTDFVGVTILANFLPKCKNTALRSVWGAGLLLLSSLSKKCAEKSEVSRVEKCDVALEKIIYSSTKTLCISL